MFSDVLCAGILCEIKSLKAILAIFSIKSKRGLIWKWNWMLGLEEVYKAGPNGGVFYMSSNQVTAALMTNILCPISLMKSNAGTAYMVNWRLFLLLLILDNNLDKMRCFWR